MDEEEEDEEEMEKDEEEGAEDIRYESHVNMNYIYIILTTSSIDKNVKCYPILCTRNRAPNCRLMT